VGHEELVLHLIRTAEAKRDEILSRARAEARRIGEDALHAAERAEREAREAAAREAARERTGRLLRARREADAIWLRARAALADAVLERMTDRLALLVREAEYPRIAERLYREILPEIPEGKVVVRTDERARETLERAAPDPRIRFEPLPEGEIGGVEASDENGVFLLRNTIRSRFLKARPALMAEVRRRLPSPDE
jgi:vacuolar-type H+-ATPase subunit E/Vma4